MTTYPQPDTKTIEGIVLDGQNFTPLPFANISFFDTKYGTTTDINGNFTIVNTNNSTQLMISYVGYQTLIIKITEEHYLKLNTFYLTPINILLQEVTVYAHQPKNIDINEISYLTMQNERIREISPVMSDILRSIQALPGIMVNNEFKADYNVRGGNQHENLILVNDAQVYEPFHIKEIANASVGIFNVDLINKVDFMTGGFNAKYGDKMSSVLNIQYREGNKTRYSGAASLSLAYLDSYIEGPLIDDISFIVGFRKSYLEYLLSLIDYQDTKTMKPSFYDLQGVLSFHISPSNKILFDFINSGDNFTYLPAGQKIFQPFISSFNGELAEFTSSKFEKDDYNATYFTNLFDIQSLNLISNKFLLKAEMSYYHEKNNEYRLSTEDYNQFINTLQSNQNYFERIHSERLTTNTLTIKTFELKSDLAYQITPSYEINAGISYKNISYTQKVDDIYTVIKNENLSDPLIIKTDTLIGKGELAEDNPIDTKSYKWAGYVENIFQVGSNFAINIGSRVDYFEINRDLTFSPRLNISYKLNNNTTLRGAWGYYYQSPNYRQLLTSASSDSNTKSQKAVHYILGIDHNISLSSNYNEYIQLKAELYYKDYKKLISSSRGYFERLIYSRQNDAIGDAKGFDFHLKLALSKFYFWMSYSLLFASENKLNDNIGSYPRYTDQRHTASFIANFKGGGGWNFTLKAFYGSGFPYTPRTAVYNNGIWDWKIGPIHSMYLPAYKRVDIRLSKDFDFSKNSKLNIFIDVSNIFNFRNVQGYEYKTPGYLKPEPEEVLLWPILPSFGIRYSF